MTKSKQCKTKSQVKGYIKFNEMDTLWIKDTWCKNYFDRPSVKFPQLSIMALMALRGKKKAVEFCIWTSIEQQEVYHQQELNESVMPV